VDTAFMGLTSCQRITIGGTLPRQRHDTTDPATTVSAAESDVSIAVQGAHRHSMPAQPWNLLGESGDP
jgi:hypothetical protein